MSRYATAEEAAQGAGALAKYLANLVRSKMDDRSEDLVSDLAERVKAEEISVREAAQLATGVLIAGHETTAGQIGVSIGALLEQPDQLALLRDAEDPKAIGTAVEELMRYVSIIQTGQRRIADEDIEVDGERIRAGEGIILDVAPANWTPVSSPSPTGWICAVTMVLTSALAMAGTNAWVSSWPAWNCRSCCRRSSGASPRCGWQCRSTSSRSNTTPLPTGSTNCRSPGDEPADAQCARSVGRLAIVTGRLAGSSPRSLRSPTRSTASTPREPFSADARLTTCRARHRSPVVGRLPFRIRRTTSRANSCS